MASYSPQITISAASGITGYLRLALYEATAPSTEVAASAQFAPPHSVSRQIQFTGLSPVIHLAKLYVTDGVSPTGTLVANFSIDPRFPGVELKAPMFIYAGTTPGFDTGASGYTDPDSELEGWDYSVDIRGFGLLNPETEVDTTGPGYEVIIDDYVLQEGELHIIRFEPKLIVYNAETDTPDLFKSVEVITADRSLVADDAGKCFLIAGAGSTITITLPEIDSVAVSKVFWFTSQGGSHVNAVIEVDGSDSEKIDYAYGENTELILGQSEQALIFKWVDPDDVSNRRWKVAQASDGILKVGELFYYGKYSNADLINAIQAAGQLIDRDVYPRLWAHVQTLDASMLISDATWGTGDTDKGKWSTGDGSTTFRVPLLYSPGFIRAVDGTVRLAGSHEAQSIEAHTHSYTGVDTVASASGSSSSRKTGDFSKTTGSYGGAETRPANTGAYLLIRI